MNSKKYQLCASWNSGFYPDRFVSSKKEAYKAAKELMLDMWYHHDNVLRGSVKILSNGDIVGDYTFGRDSNNRMKYCKDDAGMQIHPDFYNRYL